ncbi:hypothetical protein ACIBF1_23750 [Spirillospora sp. NPDC050679]
MSDEIREVARGEVPFARLEDGRVIVGHFRKTYDPSPGTLNDPEQTFWTFELDGRPFEPAAQAKRPPVSESWTEGAEEPLPAVTDGDRHTVRYPYSYYHHLGSASGEVTPSSTSAG